MTTPNTNPYAAGAPEPGGPPAGTPPAGAPATTAPPGGPAVGTVPATAAPVTPPPAGTPEALSLEQPPKPEPEQVEYAYQPTGDASFDLGLQFAGKAGFGPDSAEMQAVFNSGDFGPLEAALKARNVPGYQGYLAAAKQAVERRAQSDGATVQAVYAAVGGQETWGKVQAYFREHSDAAEKAYINQAFQLGGKVAVDVANNMLQAYKLSGLDTSPPNTGLKPNASGGEQVATAALSPKDFSAETAKLVAKYGAAGYQTRPEFQALLARRQAFRG